MVRPTHPPTSDALAARILELHVSAGALAHGIERDALLRRALKMEAAAQVIAGWSDPPSFRLPL